MIEIKEVCNDRQLKQFIKFPDILYKGNPYRVPPLHSSEYHVLSKKVNPAFEYCEATYWLAFKDGKMAGRIAGMINHKSNEIHHQKGARFGWVDFIDDREVSSALFHTVEEWAVRKGMNHLRGPLGFTDMDMEGMLVEGFNEMSTQSVWYNYPYYPVHLEAMGYVKEVDWIHFEIKVPEKIPDKVLRVSNLVTERYGMRVLKVRKAKELLPYAPKMFQTLNEAYANLYEFVPLNDKQIEYYTREYFSFINPDFVCFVLDKDDEVAGFGISLYSLSKALIKAKGKLFPFGFIHILKALHKNDTVDLLLLAVKPKYQNKGVPALFFAEIMKACIRHGVKKAITAYILEHNVNPHILFDDYEHRQHLRRRSYGKSLV